MHVTLRPVVFAAAVHRAHTAAAADKQYVRGTDCFQRRFSFN